MDGEAGPSVANEPHVDDHEGDQGGAEEFLEEWAVTGGARKRRRGQMSTWASGRLLDAHRGFIGTEKLRYQHLSLLVTAMRHFNAICDDASLALVLGTLLQAEVSSCPQFPCSHAQLRGVMTSISSFSSLESGNVGFTVAIPPPCHPLSILGGVHDHLGAPPAPPKHSDARPD